MQKMKAQQKRELCVPAFWIVWFTREDIVCASPTPDPYPSKIAEYEGEMP